MVKIWKTASTHLRRMSSSSRSSFRSVRPPHHQGHSRRSRNSGAVPISYFWKTRWWWVTTWNRGQMRSTIWTPRMASELASVSWTRSNVCASASRQSVLPGSIASSSPKPTRSSTRKAPSAIWQRFLTQPRRDSHTCGWTVKSTFSPKMCWRLGGNCSSNLRSFNK